MGWITSQAAAEMAESDPIDYIIAIPAFVGSLLSFLGSAIAFWFQIARPPQRHFRHSLIVNLLVADLVYGLGNTISGAIFLANGRTPSPLNEPSVMCRVSGWFSQSNGQAVDFNILIISIALLLSVAKNHAVTDLDMKWQVCLCVAAWIPGFITGTIGLATGSYRYGRGNWCWIRSTRLDLRYALSYGWRIGIFFITIGIYTYIFIKLKIVSKGLRGLSTSTVTNTLHDDPDAVPSDSDNDTQKILVAHTVSVSVSHELHSMTEGSDDRMGKLNCYPYEVTTQSTASFYRTTANDDSVFEQSSMPATPSVKKMLLLMNGYPMAYIILWIPGIANMLVESVGTSPRWLSSLQACTQYIGLANALTYGMSEQMRRGVWEKLKDTGRSG
ncbi:hypothetical protein NLU13_3464 [Sarocladium strictum]|uniref:Glucose receptor Git3-like N-terminal domain-containing protein n=1 Tax=Sarocladium strictum TaxID=5046 RepID=A0AA39GMS8_SARSR|nr:hypothetical protein NLU13_3464 [Sarocladium strictum]